MLIIHPICFLAAQRRSGGKALTLEKGFVKAWSGRLMGSKVRGTTARHLTASNLGGGERKGGLSWLL